MKKISFADYDLKHETLILVKCIILPHLITGKVYSRIADRLKNVGNQEFRLKLFFSLDHKSFLS